MRYPRHNYQLNCLWKPQFKFFSLVALLMSKLSFHDWFRWFCRMFRISSLDTLQLNLFRTMNQWNSMSFFVCLLFEFSSKEICYLLFRGITDIFAEVMLAIGKLYSTSSNTSSNASVNYFELSVEDRDLVNSDSCNTALQFPYQSAITSLFYIHNLTTFNQSQSVEVLTGADTVYCS